LRSQIPAEWPTGSVEDEYAGFGVTIADEGPYDACAYTGLRIFLESESPVDVAFASGPTATDSTDVYETLYDGSTDVPFSSLSGFDCSQLTQLVFVPTDLTSWGIAVYRIELY
jgi:hypothetical protein